MHRANRKFVSIIPTSAINGTYQALLNTWIFCIIGLLILASFLSVKEARNNRQNINAVLNAFEAAERGK